MRYYQILSEAVKGFNQPLNYVFAGILGAVLAGALMYKHYKLDADKPSSLSIGAAVSGGLEDRVKATERITVDKLRPENTSSR